MTEQDWVDRNKKKPISLIVLTKDEELNLGHCLRSAAGHVERIIIVDSGSTDATLQIAKEHGAEIYEHTFQNQAAQFNWALDSTNISSEWILRLDADETVPEELWAEINTVIKNSPPEVTGFYIRRRVYFMGRWMRHGGYYPAWFLRLFRRGKARSEVRAMDEHMILSEGRALRLKNDFRDENHKGLEWWVAKHNDYSSREAQAMLAAKNASDDEAMRPKVFGTQPERKRWIKHNIYYRLPAFVRPFLYFILRYFFLRGFLDGKEGFLFHFLQGFWYRLLVDAKYQALVREARSRSAAAA